MTHLKTTAHVALIALLSTAPVAAFATTSGSPQQSVVADPDEKVERKIEVDAESMEDTAKADQGEGAYDDSEVKFGEPDGSLIADDAKTDDASDIDG